MTVNKPTGIMGDTYIRRAQVAAALSSTVRAEKTKFRQDTRGPHLRRAASESEQENIGIWRGGAPWPTGPLNQIET